VLSVLLFAYFHGEGSALSNFDVFPLFATCIYLFCFSSSLPPTCSSYISFDATSVFFTPHRSRSHPCSLFLLFSALYFADMASKIITSFPPLFFFTYFPENHLRLAVYRAVIVKPILPFFFSPNTNPFHNFCSFLPPFLLFFALARLLSCS